MCYDAELKRETPKINKPPTPLRRFKNFKTPSKLGAESKRTS
jgi:hypothetical protein